MIDEKELRAAVAAMEQHVRDCEGRKGSSRHDPAALKHLSGEIAEAKVKLQVLHYAQGVTGTISEKTLASDLAALAARIEELNGPREVDLFGSFDDRALDSERREADRKWQALEFVAGRRKSIF